MRAPVLRTTLLAAAITLVLAWSGPLPASAAQSAARSVPGGTIVFGAYAVGASTSDLYAMNPDGSGLHQLTNTPDIYEQQPAVTRDGRKLLFRVSDITFLQSTFEVYTSDLDGSHLTRVTNNTWMDESPTWTPDGTHIVVSSNRNDPNPNCDRPPCRLDLFVMRADGSHMRQITHLKGGLAFFPSVAPDGRTVLFTLLTASGDTLLETVNMDGSGLRQLTSPADEAWNGRWSPDGNRIVFSDQGCLTCPACDVWTMNADGSDRIRVTNHKTNDVYAAWSPDGRWLTFEGDSAKGGEIYLVRSSGGGKKKLTHVADNFEPAWAP